MNADSGKVTVPEGVGSVLESYLDLDLRIHAVQHAGAQLELVVAAEEDGEQAECRTTTRFSTDCSEDPWLTYGPTDTQLTPDLLVEDMTVSGAFSADGESISGIRVAGVVDTRPLVPLVEEDGDDDSVCNLVAGFGVSCVTCADGEDLCLVVVIEEGTASAIDETVVEREECDGSCPEEECDSCSCASVTPASAGWLVALLGLAGLRRRR